MRLTCDLTHPNRKHTIFLTLDAFASVVGTVLVQVDDKDQMQVISYYSGIFTGNKQKLAKKDCELTAIVYVLEIYENLLFGSNLLDNNFR